MTQVDPIKLQLKDAAGDSDKIKVFKDSPGQARIKAIDEDKRFIDFIVSTSDVDRHKDIVYPKGIDYQAFMENPVVLWAHDHREPIAIGSNMVATDTEFAMRKTFQPADLNPLAETLFQLYAKKFLRAASIGFIPKKWAWAEERGPWAIDYYEVELIESSCVSVGANAGALAQAKAAGVNVRSVAEHASKIIDELGDDDPVKRAMYEKAWRAASDSPIFSFAKALFGASSTPPVDTESELKLKSELDNAGEEKTSAQTPRVMTRIIF